MSETVFREINFLDHTYAIECWADDFQTRRLSKGKPYEIRELRVVAAVVKALGLRGLALDLGSSIGNHSLAFSRMGFDQIHAVEMDPETYKVLGRNLARSCAVPFASTNCALGEANPETLYRTKRWQKNCGANALVPTSDQALAVKTVALATLGLRPATLAKIDVEGHEVPVLRGGAEYFARVKPLLLIEIWAKLRPQVFAELQGLGYGEGVLLPGEEKHNFLFSADQQQLSEVRAVVERARSTRHS